MAKLNDLPSDVLVDVLLCTPNLGDLYDVITSCKRFYQAFDERRALALQIISARQTQMYHDDVSKHMDHQPGHKKCEEYVNNVARTMKRCMKRPNDALSLGISAWKCFVKFESPLWVHVGFGRMLVSRCTNQERYELAVSVASDLWYRMLERRTFEARTMSMASTRLEISRFAQKLAIMYVNLGRHDDAVRTFREHYQSHYTLREYGAFAALIKICREKALQGDKELVAFSRAQVTESQQRFLQLPMRSSKGFDHYWSHCLITLLFELGRYEEAVSALENALAFSEQSNSSPMILIGLSRKLIKQLKDIPENEEAIRFRRLVFDFMCRSPDRQASASSYLAWAKEFAADLRLLGRREESLEIEVLVWERLRARARSCNNRSMVYHCRNAAWGLCRAYREHGYLERASETVQAYKDLAAYSNDPLFRLPGGFEESSVFADGTRATNQSH